jgi:hypothetical protein
MFRPAPLDSNAVLYARRPITKYNAALFVDGGRGRASGATRVIPQSIILTPGPCFHKQPGEVCNNGMGICQWDGSCG